MTPGDLDSGERLLTAEQAAARLKMLRRSWLRGVIRGDFPEADGHVGRTPCWLESTVEETVRQRAS